MKTPTRRADYFGVVSTLVIALSVCLLQANGLLQTSDDYLCDQVSAYSAVSCNRSNVLLVYAPQEVFSSDDARLADLVQAISRFQPANVGIAHPLSQSQLQRLESQHDAANIVLGYKRDPMPTGLPASVVCARANPARIQAGFTDLYLDGEGVYRKHVARHADSQSATWSFEAALARQLQPSINTLPEGVIRVRFRAGVDGLPNVPAGDFADDRLIPEIISGRVVIIGAGTPDGLGFITPTTTGSERMQTLELRGNIVECLLSQTHISLLGFLSTVWLLMFVTLFSVQSCRNTHGRWMVRIVFLIALACTGMSWLCVSAWSIQLPVTAMLVCIAAAFVRVQYQRYFVLKRVLDNWDAERHTADRISFDELHEDVWPALAISVNQIFNPRRMLLMEVKPGATHANVVYHHACNDDDIHEPRRDVRRPPYKTAIDQRYPLRTDAFPLLNPEEPSDCIEFVVPLIMVSELIGIMVLEIEMSVIERWEHLDDCLSHYADEMAIYLASTRTARDEIGWGKRLANQMRTLPENTVATALYKDEIEHRRVSEMLGSALNSVESSLAVCDIFGQLVRTNARMDALLKDKDVPGLELTCVDILAALTGYPADNCRDIFRRCIVENHVEQVVLDPPSKDTASSMMFVKSLSEESASGAESRFVAIEIVSGKVFRMMEQWHSEYQNALAETAGEQSGSQRGTAEQFASIDSTNLLSSIATEVLQSVEEVHEVVETRLSQSPQDCYPLDSAAILLAAIASQKAAIDVHGTNLVSKLATHANKCFANPYLLEKSFATVIGLLLRDCDDQTDLIINSTQSSSHLRYSFGTRLNSAITPSEDQELNHSSFLDSSYDGLLTKPQRERLSEIQTWLSVWGAELTTRCDSGFRVVFAITFSTTTEPAKVEDAEAVS